jgi:hypothetical protein
LALKKFEEAERKKADADKSDLQKAQERAAELEKALSEMQEATDALRVRQAFGSVAGKLELKFASPQAEEDAFELADMEGVEISADGKVTGLEKALKSLQASRPYLFASEDAGATGQGTPRANGKTSAKLNKEGAQVKVRF